MKKHIKTRLILLYNITLIISAMIMYYIIPIFLNYGPDTINTEFDKVVSGGLAYYQQIIVIVVLLIALITAVLSFVFRDFDNYKYYKKQFEKTNDPLYEKKLKKIKSICFLFPNYVLIFLITIPIMLEVLLLLGQTYTSTSDFKLVLIIFIITTIAVSIDNIYVRKLFSKVLIDLENNTLPEKRNSVFSRFVLQIVPLIAAGIIFTFLAISSVYERDRGILLSDFYTLQFENMKDSYSITNYEELVSCMQTISLSKDTDILFIADSDFNYHYSTGELSDFFKKYSKELALNNNNIVYDYYGTYGQGVLFPIEINGETWYVGSHYLIYSNEIFSYMLFYIIIIFFISLLILIYFSKQISKDLESMNNSLESIYGENRLYQKIYITSNDELGKLTRSINEIQDLNKRNVEQIQDDQDKLMERERLASLGQLIGGIAHNLKTPIMSISGAAEGLSDLVKEYDSSIGDSEVTNEDHHAIASDMNEWIDKVKSYTEYMSDVITAVKGQAVTLSEEQITSFDIEELLKRVNILMRHELKNALVTLNFYNNVGTQTHLHGNINSLVQVVNNMISNAIQAYGGVPNKEIDLIIKKENDSIIISIKDYAGGLPKEVQEKLFKEMITTKGKNGTGLGLFMSYSTIRAHFNGNITFDTEKGKGTTFNIILPI